MKTCDDKSTENARRVAAFVLRYGSIDNFTTYTCFYNAEIPWEVILRKTTKTTVILAMFCPSLIFVICFVILISSYFGPERDRGINEGITTSPESEEMMKNGEV